ncbi:MAG TPA: histidine phosphatase family protein [Herpetosiphonaceae bacterium]
MKQRTRIILVRHGETAANREMRYIGSRDDELTERGQQQAQHLAHALATLPIHALYVSPRRRTRATAQPLAATLGLPIVVADELRENAFGSWEGMSRAEVLAHSTEYAAQHQAWESDPSLAPPGGESIAAMAARVEVFATGLCARHPDQTIVLVSHVGPIKALIAVTLGVPPGVAQRMFLDPATISVIDWSGAQRVLRLFNSHAHLGWHAARWMEP